MDDLISIKPKIHVKNDYCKSVNYALKQARILNQKGQKSKWYLKGGIEREKATEIYR